MHSTNLDPKGAEATEDAPSAMVYSFTEAAERVDPEHRREVLGGKGMHLVTMSQQGLPIPAGVIVTTDACKHYLTTGRLPDGLITQVLSKLQELPRQQTQLIELGDKSLFSVRSGSPASMPGMLRTILNVGFRGRPSLGDGQTRFALAAYLRFLLGYAELVLDDREADTLRGFHSSRDGNLIDHRSAGDLKSILDDLESRLEIYDRPLSLETQIRTCIEGVMKSWLSPKAQRFRRSHINSLPDDSGTAVIVQQMVFGNYNGRSGSGVAYSRDPSTGKRVLSGNFLTEVQGEDVVSGEVAPKSIEELNCIASDAFEALERHCLQLEEMVGSIAEVEFTVQDERLWLLQARAARLSGAAAVRFAYDSVNGQGPGGTTAWSGDEALLWEGLTPIKLLQATAPRFADTPPMGWSGTGVSPGAATGYVAYDAQQLDSILQEGSQAIWVAKFMSTEQLQNVERCAGVVTTTAGMSSHSIVVARGWGLPVVTGVDGSISDDSPELSFPRDRYGREYFPQREPISIDGSTGYLYKGTLKVVEADHSQEVRELLEWCNNAIRSEGPALRVNADTAEQAEASIRRGAQGVGLARFEGLLDQDANLSRMFAKLAAVVGQRRVDESMTDRLDEIAESPTYSALRDRLAEAYADMFAVTIDENPRRKCVVRLVDELSPGEESYLRRGLGVPAIDRVRNGIRLRGAQIFVVAAPLVTVQIDALVEALNQTDDPGDAAGYLEVLVPFCMSAKEFRRAADFTRSRFRKFADGCRPLVGAMLETPRSLILAENYVSGPDAADFISLGLNDLTELVMGLVQVEHLVKTYRSEGILTIDPLTGLDRAVSTLVNDAVAAVRSAAPGIDVHVASEQVNDAESVAEFVRLGVSTLSCAPKQFDGLRLAAAKAVISQRQLNVPGPNGG